MPISERVRILKNVGDMGLMLNRDKSPEKKLEDLKVYLGKFGHVMIAFSGGVDSVFLLHVAQEILGERAVAVTADSFLFPQRELDEAREFCISRGIRHIIFESEELASQDFCSNPVNRCYICKRKLFERILLIGRKEGIVNIAEGSNMDDMGDYRPGLQAVEELGIKSPLRHVGLFKSEIRMLSQKSDLPTWEKPSFACLATRIAYGDLITKEKLSMVGQGEQCLLDLGFHQIRVRIHGQMARIEVGQEEFERLLCHDIREQIISRFRELGFTYISMDLEGYRTGSMNEGLR